MKRYNYIIIVCLFISVFVFLLACSKKAQQTFSKEEIIGALNIASKSRYTFTEEEKDSLQYIGREIGSTISKMKAEDALRESEKKYRSLLDSSKFGIMEINVANEKLSYINKNFLDIVGYSREEFNDRNLSKKVIHPEDYKVLNPLEEYQKQTRIRPRKKH